MPFKVINDINAGKEPETPEKFSPWLTNRFYSFFPDTLMYAQYMNLNYDLEPKYQLSFYINTIRPSKRWQKWLKKEQSASYDLVQQWYNFGDRKTREALAVLTKEQLEVLKKKNKKDE